MDDTPENKPVEATPQLSPKTLAEMEAGRKSLEEQAARRAVIAAAQAAEAGEAFTPASEAEAVVIKTPRTPRLPKPGTTNPEVT